MILCSITAVVLSFQNCSGVGFNGIDPSQKSLTIGDNDDLLGDVWDDVPRDNRTPDTEGPKSLNPSLRFDRICSENRTEENNGVTLMNSSVIDLKITLNDQVVCSYSDAAQFKAGVLASNSLNLPNCTLDPNQRYTLKITGDQGKSLLYDRSSMSLSIKRSNSYVVHLLMDTNLRGQSDQPHCDDRKSPLVLDTRRNIKEKGVRLSSPEDGILFDIMGLRSIPVAHAKRRISWPKSKRYEFLVLPNSAGKVEGINEMFGDNTLGPDGDFSANGFTALAKFDGKDASGKVQINAPDGVINKDDEIFSYLRLWSDKNRDGISQKSELRSLQDAEVEIIDLNYDAGYEEMDRYGNMTKYKSVAKFKDGELRMVFDVWFKDFGPE